MMAIDTTDGNSGSSGSTLTVVPEAKHHDCDRPLNFWLKLAVQYGEIAA